MTSHFKLIAPITLGKPGHTVLILPIKTVSEANNSEHWKKKNARHRSQKIIVLSYLHISQNDVTPPCSIILTRIAPRSMDYDNLVSSFKWILDAVCDYLIPGLNPGRADSDKRLTISYSQTKGLTKQYGIKIEIIKKI